MASVFWDSNGVILIDYLQKGKTITRAYYSSLFDKMKAELKEKRPHLQKKSCSPKTKHRLTPQVAMAEIHELRFELLGHPPYSLDLAPSDLFFIPSSKTCARGTEIFVK
ncbi:histone-lysine N-methyltransferase SETMAR [Trichonephila clavipes]|uniref:Histone-lysine N-methyltransferase SETMAR n=1 Tax=Trichonephila clavipes TaxID=2585209 RepID=A0A8X6VHR1_TRICX|nr:histone-lysine N-methyltransferase SETMAR [Trichonephila clavipes]